MSNYIVKGVFILARKNKFKDEELNLNLYMDNYTKIEFKNSLKTFY